MTPTQRKAMEKAQRHPPPRLKSKYLADIQSRATNWIDALQKVETEVRKQFSDEWKRQQREISELRAALAEPAPEPVGYEQHKAIRAAAEEVNKHEELSLDQLVEYLNVVPMEAVIALCDEIERLRKDAGRYQCLAV